jgi:predicted dehydrogenase
MIARVHLDAARRVGATVVGLSASTPERGKRAAAELGVERAFATSAELAVSADVDVVHICTPNASHGPLAELALRAGKHVVCEKPLAITPGEARALAALAAQHDAVAAVPFVYRYHPMAAEARARSRAGALGAAHLIHGHYLQDWLSRPSDANWRVDPAEGGPSRAFADIGSHWCDLAEWITGHRVTELAALTATVHGERPARGAHSFSVTAHDDGPGRDDAPAAMLPVTTEDVAHLMFRTDQGATGSLVVSQVSPGHKNRLWIEVDGALAGVRFDQENPESLLLGTREGVVVVPRDNAVLDASAARLSALPAGHPLGYHDCFAAFLADVYADVRARATGGARHDRGAAPYPTFDDAARAAAITDAVLTAARTRCWTEVS